MSHLSRNTFYKVLSLLCAISFLYILPIHAANPASGDKDNEVNNEPELLALSTSTTVTVELVKVRGFVIDEFGEPMVGVEIYAEGSDFKAITNTEGKYTVMAKADDTLKFSQFGVKSKKEKVTSSKILNVSLTIE